MRYGYIAWRLATAILNNFQPARQLARAFCLGAKRILPQPTLSFCIKKRVYPRYQLPDCYA